jgi:hypothetical protein
MVAEKEAGMEMRNSSEKGKVKRGKGCFLGACFLSVWLSAGMVVSLGAQTKSEPEARELRVLIVMGAQGTEEYGKRYREEVQLWEETCKKAGVVSQTIGVAEEQKEKTDAVLLQEALKTHSAKPTQPLWLVLIGHGTFDGRDARFNLRGPDIMAPELATWLKAFSGQVACIQTASASAPFLKALAGPNRVLVSATKSADEVFYTRFGQFFVKAIGGAEEADLDRDHQVSLLEAFLWSSKQVDRFFEVEQRLATEHALIEDNGDGIGTRAQAFHGVRLAEAPPEGKTAEGLLARQWALLLSDADAQLTDVQRTKRDGLEREVEALKAKRKELGDDAYYLKLESLLLEISRIYETSEKDT